MKSIWETKRLTNQGYYHQEFEKQLADYLGVKYVSLFANGTLALICALQVLRITGEVITTPYSFVATTHALHWNNIKPVFCDIGSLVPNINPEKIEKNITPKTNAILPVHVYGIPCEVDRIQEIADVYGLKVIYDACHAFGVRKSGKSITTFGDLSILSFHATKVFTTMEGGAIVCHDEKVKKRVDFLKNFGFAGETQVMAPGINAKMNEAQAALGLLQLKSIDGYIEKRKQVALRYREGLKGITGIKMLDDSDDVRHNYAYFPVFIDEDEYGLSRDVLYEMMKQENIYGRRYFYPLISQFPTYRGLDSASPDNLPEAEKLTKQVICLPIYPQLEMTTVDRICELLRSRQFTNDV